MQTKLAVIFKSLAETSRVFLFAVVFRGTDRHTPGLLHIYNYMLQVEYLMFDSVA